MRRQGAVQLRRAGNGAVSYAATTSVSVEKTKGEIERLLRTHGATKFASMWDQDHAAISFILGPRTIRLELPLPHETERRFTHTPDRGRVRTRQQAADAWEQACRSSWRSLYLVLKAKLEAIQSGIATADAEFLSYVVVAGNRTVGEAIAEQLEAASTGKGVLMLGPKS